MLRDVLSAPQVLVRHISHICRNTSIQNCSGYAGSSACTIYNIFLASVQVFSCQDAAASYHYRLRTRLLLNALFEALEISQEID